MTADYPPSIRLPLMQPDSTDHRDAPVTCATCRACCCRLEVILMGEDDVPEHLTVEDRWGGRVMTRLADGWCAALDRETMRCRIYERRPGICRDYELGGSDCLAERAKDPAVFVQIGSAADERR